MPGLRSLSARRKAVHTDTVPSVSETIQGQTSQIGVALTKNECRSVAYEDDALSDKNGNNSICTLKKDHPCFPLLENKSELPHPKTIKNHVIQNGEALGSYCVPHINGTKIRDATKQLLCKEKIVVSDNTVINDDTHGNVTAENMSNLDVDHDIEDSVADHVEQKPGVCNANVDTNGNITHQLAHSFSSRKISDHKNDIQHMSHDLNLCDNINSCLELNPQGILSRVDGSNDISVSVDTLTRSSQIKSTKFNKKDSSVSEAQDCEDLAIAERPKRKAAVIASDRCYITLREYELIGFSSSRFSKAVECSKSVKSVNALKKARRNPTENILNSLNQRRLMLADAYIFDDEIERSNFTPSVNLGSEFSEVLETLPVYDTVSGDCQESIMKSSEDQSVNFNDDPGDETSYDLDCDKKLSDIHFESSHSRTTCDLTPVSGELSDVESSDSGYIECNSGEINGKGISRFHPNNQHSSNLDAHVVSHKESMLHYIPNVGCSTECESKGSSILLCDVFCGKLSGICCPNCNKKYDLKSSYIVVKLNNSVVHFCCSHCSWLLVKRIRPKCIKPYSL